MNSNSKQLQINLKLNSVFISNISIINLKLVYTHANTHKHLCMKSNNSVNVAKN